MIVLGIVVYLILGVIGMGLVGREVERTARDRALDIFVEPTEEIRKTADQADEAVGDEFYDYFVEMTKTDKPHVISIIAIYLLAWPVYTPLMIYRVRNDYQEMLDVIENKM